MATTSGNSDATRGGLLRAARLRAGLSQEQLARRADCSAKMVFLLEHDYWPARSHVRDKLALILAEAEEAAAATRKAETAPDASV